LTSAFVQREVALAGVALLAAIGALAIASPNGTSSHLRGLPKPVSPTGGSWYRTRAGAGENAFGRTTTCGIPLKRSTIGVAHSELRCGTKVYLAFGKSPQVLTEVIDHRPVVFDRGFDLTPALAAKLGVEGVRWIRWVYAR
jgi:hypothetical protein